MKVIFDLFRAPTGKGEERELIRYQIDDGFNRFCIQSKNVRKGRIPAPPRIEYLVFFFKQIKVFLYRFIRVVDALGIKICFQIFNAKVFFVFGIIENIFFQRFKGSVPCY